MSIMKRELQATRASATDCWWRPSPQRLRWRSFLFVVPTEAQITVKMATLVPDGTSWATILKEAAEKWKKISNGRVTVNIYWGGVCR